MKKETVKINSSSLPVEPKKLLEQMAQKAKEFVSQIPRKGEKKRSV